MNDFGYYILCVVVFVLGILVLKKVAGCLIKTLTTFILIAAFAVLLWLTGWGEVIYRVLLEKMS